MCAAQIDTTALAVGKSAHVSHDYSSSQCGLACGSIDISRTLYDYRLVIPRYAERIPAPADRCGGRSRITEQAYTDLRD